MTGISGFSTSVGIALILIIGGLILSASGYGLIGKKKVNLFCMDCRKKFAI